jgi:hypothetical protein
MKLTPWFTGDQRPVRVGVYLRKYSDSEKYEGYSYFDGAKWSTFGITPQVALCERYITSVYQNLPWRGVMK